MARIVNPKISKKTLSLRQNVYWIMVCSLRWKIEDLVNDPLRTRVLASLKARSLVGYFIEKFNPQ